MKKIAILLGLALINPLSANMGPAGFDDFANYYFVETGTFSGDSLAKVLKTDKFQELYSIELSEINFRDCCARFQENANVHLTLGDSTYALGALISPLDQPITFWLDAHQCPADPNGKNTPLLEELEQIKAHPIKTHTILIDDMHCCGTDLFDFITRDEIAAKVLEINPNYTIYYVAGGDDGEYPNNVLVARVFE